MKKRYEVLSFRKALREYAIYDNHKDSIVAVVYEQHLADVIVTLLNQKPS